MNIYNKARKPFAIEGIAKDQESIVRIRQELEDRIEEGMRVQGYVPSLDITPELFWQYIEEDENFKYAVIMYGVYVGKKQAKTILGILGPHPIMMD